jgi:hypothetical protein
MTMDFLFQCPGGQNLHVAVKMSTRERIVQAWAHQKVLEGAFKEDAYSGILVLFSETKLAIKSLEVVEICVPDQWLVYQTLLTRMNQIYYFDAPYRHQELASAYPDLIPLQSFTEFLIQTGSILSA